MVDFTIGCEVEVTMELLAVKAAQRPRITNLADFAEFVASQHKKNRQGDEIALQSDVEGGKEGNCWSLIDDVTIDTSSSKEWPIEVVSPILEHKPDGKWMGQIQALFDNLRRVCSIRTNKSCGFHVHFAPVGGWDLERLKALCRAFLYLEPAFEAILPVERRRNEYAKSNRFDNPRLSGKTGQEIFKALDSCKHAVDVVDLLNDGGDRYFGWNLTNLYVGRIQTVEFRRGPGVKTYGQCVAWVEFVVRFAQAAFGVSTSKLLQYSQDVDGLWKFIKENSHSPTADLDIIRPLFHDKSGSLTPKPVRDLTEAEQQKLEKKKAQADQKNLITMKMRFWYERR